MRRQPTGFRGRRWEVDLIVLLAVVVVIAVLAFESPRWIYQPLASLPFPIRLLALVALMIYMFTRDAVLKAKHVEHLKEEQREYIDKRLAEARIHYDERMNELIRKLDEIRPKVE